MQYFIRAVLFDLGGTLMHARHPWPPVMARANRALAEALCAQGLELDCENLHLEFEDRLNDYYISRDENLFETTYLFTLRSMLAEKGYPKVPESVMRTALDAMYQVTQSNWVLEEDTLPTLRKLEAGGYRLGILSNAGDNDDVYQLARKFGIEPFFDFILTSAACSYRKPHPRIFELALGNWKLKPYEAAMVGDTLEADIQGANQVGIYSVWINRRVVRPAEGEEDILPRATINTLSELPNLLPRV
jgi:putative hydrolase of the HAD superfamily